jgi:hypothetical protein
MGDNIGNFNNSTIISSQNSKININSNNVSGTDDKKSKKKKKKEKAEAKLREKRNHIMQMTAAEELIYSFAKVLSETFETHPEIKEHISGLNSMKRLVSSIDLYENITEKPFIFKNDILKDYTEIDFSDSYTEKENSKGILEK